MVTTARGLFKRYVTLPRGRGSAKCDSPILIVLKMVKKPDIGRRDQNVGNFALRNV